ncbi:MAG: DUF2442 domain-containing protein [Bacteroidia bacterium]|nr:DUF2442 domain-containing protein [Bacteroidia bacterium]
MNKIVPNIKLAVALPDYKLFLEFEDGIKGEVDLSNFKSKAVFNYWNKVDNFLKVYVTDHGSIAWSDDIEIDSINCYLKITNQTFYEYAHHAYRRIN